MHSKRDFRPEGRSVNFLHNEHHPGSNRLKQWGIFGVAIVLIGIGIFFLLLTVSKSENRPNDLHRVPEEQLEPKSQGGFFSKIKKIVFHRSIDEDLIGERDDRVNILLLGQGGPGHDGPYLTDTIILASIRPSTGEIALLSIPRDFAIDIPEYGRQKINHANHFGELDEPDSGAKVATYVTSKLLDIEIPYYVRVDFESFRQIIDLVGGVTLYVERSFVDNEYPGPDDTYRTVRFSKGIHDMDAETALTYARSRHGNNGEGSDFARGRRQQKVLLALKEKILSTETLLNPIRVKKILDSLETGMVTNLTIDEFITLYNLNKIHSTTKSRIRRHVLETGPTGLLESGWTAEGSYILQPKGGGLSAIQFLADNIFDDVEPTIDDTPIQLPIVTPAGTSTVEVQNGTWHAGLAARVRMALLEQEIPVEHIGNTNEKPFVLSGLYIIVNEEKSTETAEYVKTFLDIPVKSAIPEGETYASSTDILIILGEDFDESLIE